MTIILDLPIEILMHISTFIKGNLYWKFFRDSNKYFKENLPSRLNHYETFHAMRSLEKQGYHSYVKSFLKENNFFCSINRYNKFIKHGHLGCFEYLITKKKLNVNFTEFIDHAIRFARLDILEKLSKHERFEPDAICHEAVIWDQLSVLKWARAHNYPWNDSICPTAVKEGNLDILKWAIKHDYPWTKKIYKIAAKRGHLDILEWCRVSKYSWDNSICLIAAKRDNVDMFNWIKKNNLSWNIETYNVAKHTNHSDVIKWIKQNNYPYDMSQEININCPSCLCVISESDRTQKKICDICSYNKNDIYCHNCINYCIYCMKSWCIKCNILIQCENCDHESCKGCMGTRCIRCKKIKCCHNCLTDYQCSECYNDYINSKSEQETKLISKRTLSYKQKRNRKRTLQRRKKVNN